MPQHIFEDPTRFQPQLKALEEHKDIFQYVEYREEEETVGGLRRRRRRAGNTPENPIKTVSLVEEDGVLFWRDGVPASGSSLRRRRARAGLPAAPDGTLVLAKQFPVLKPNKVAAGIGTIDKHLNPSIPGHSARDCGRCARNPTINLFSTRPISQDRFPAGRWYSCMGLF